MLSIPEAASRRLGVFSLEEARAAGWTADALRHAVRRSRLNRIRPGVFQAPPATCVDPFEVARRSLAASAYAVALTNPSAVISHTSAAILEGLAVWRQPAIPCLTVRPHFVGDIEGAHLHRAALPGGHLSSSAGVATTSVARTVIDIGREGGILSALVTADAALHADLVDRKTLRDLVGDCRGWPGVRAARQAIEFADGRSESPLESASRFTLHERVPTPELQASIHSTSGQFLGRSDFLWEEFGVVGEADGLQKYEGGSERSSLRAEKIRQEGFERAGLTVVRWGSEDLRTPDELVRRLRLAFAKGQRAGAESCRRWVVRRSPRAA